MRCDAGVSWPPKELLTMREPVQRIHGAVISCELKLVEFWGHAALRGRRSGTLQGTVVGARGAGGRWQHAAAEEEGAIHPAVEGTRRHGSPMVHYGTGGGRHGNVRPGRGRGINGAGLPQGPCWYLGWRWWESDHVDRDVRRRQRRRGGRRWAGHRWASRRGMRSAASAGKTAGTAGVVLRRSASADGGTGGWTASSAASPPCHC